MTCLNKSREHDKHKKSSNKSGGKSEQNISLKVKNVFNSYPWRINGKRFSSRYQHVTAAPEISASINI